MTDLTKELDKVRSQLRAARKARHAHGMRQGFGALDEKVTALETREDEILRGLSGTSRSWERRQARQRA